MKLLIESLETSSQMFFFKKGANAKILKRQIRSFNFDRYKLGTLQNV